MVADRLRIATDVRLPDLKISVINYNTKNLLKECLLSLLDESTTFPVTVEIIDNASVDGSIEMVKEAFPQIHLIESKENLGFAKAANLALKNASEKYVLILNSDTKLKSGCVEILVGFMEKTPGCAAAGPLLLNFDGSLQRLYSGRRFLGLDGFIAHGLLGAVWPQNPWTREYMMDGWDRSETMEVDWVSGAGVLLRTEAVKEVGLFDENYFMYVEDMDLCYRLKKNSWKTYLVTEAQIFHHIGQASKQNRIKMKIEHFKSHFRFLLKKL
jgi:GT2 family glycosyltransferase